MKTMQKQNKSQRKLPNIVDLFSGCGGLSYGFSLEGFDAETGVEYDIDACNTASYNLYWKKGEDKEHLCSNITAVKPSNLVKSSNPLITIGGPPCQAYSKIGKAKLRSLGSHQSGINDSRAFLYEEFIRLSTEVDSEAIVMENVPESVNFLGENIPQKVCEILEENDYNAIWTILNAADFGVPQTRERVFVIAIKKRYGEIRYLPEPTHISPADINDSELQSKYQKFNSLRHFKPPLTADKNAPEWITTEDALADLPALFPNSNTKYVLNKMNTQLPYQMPPVNAYQKFMRWSPVKSFIDLADANCFRKTERDFRIFERMNYGDDYRDACKIANDIFEEARKYYRVEKDQKSKYEELKKAYIPPYDNTKFHAKWKKLDPSKPSHTLVAHLGTDTYSHINPWEPRGISVREAARLQSFPDSFTFNTTMSQAFKQIGNAVPPLLSKGVAKAVRKNIEYS